MGVTHAGDTVGGVHFVVGPITSASRASNAADATTRQWRAPHSCTLVAFDWIATGADQAGAHATNHAGILIQDGGTDGTGTALLASIGFTATLASDTPTTTTGTTAIVLAAGDYVNILFGTQATASSTGSMAAGEAFVTFKYA